MATRTDLYGSGFAYPFGFDFASGGVVGAIHIDSVRASLSRLFDTAPGEEFMLPGYGCGLKNFVFEADTDVLRALIDGEIRRAVAQWEPRIDKVLQVNITRDDVNTPNLLTITVFFSLIQSQVVQNLVYPWTLPTA